MAQAGQMITNQGAAHVRLQVNSKGEALNGPGVTPIVEKVIAGLHEFDASDEGDIAIQQKQSAKLAAWGGRSGRGDCSKGWFES